MKRALILFFFCVTLARAGTPIVDPASCFEKWPWTNSIPSTWYIQETNTHAIKQLWYSIQDRVSACGQGDAPAYQKLFALSHGIKTNWMYTNWAQWGSSTTTNNYMTNYWPTLQLIFRTNLWNAVEPFTNTYPLPQYAGTDFDATNKLTNELAYTPVISNMLLVMVDTVERICTNYVPQTASNLIKALPFDSPLPRYHMAGLLTDAGCDDLVSNLQYDATSTYVTNGNWAWRYTLPMSNMIYVKALDDLAAAVAQLNKSILIAQPCSPSYTADYGVNSNSALSGIIITNKMLFSEVGEWPYAYSQTSLDSTWLDTTFVQGGNKIFNFDREDLLALQPDYITYYQTNKPSDWPSNGWYASVSYDFDWTAIRTNADTEPIWLFIPLADSPYSGAIVTTNQNTNTGTTGWGYVQGRNDSSNNWKFWTGTDTNSLAWQEGYYVDGYEAYYYLSNVTAAAGAMTTNFFDLLEKIIRVENPRTFVSTGAYTRHTNNVYSNAWTDYVAFTSRVSSNAWTVVESNKFEWIYTNANTYTAPQTNVIQFPSGISNYIDGGWTYDPQSFVPPHINCTGFFDFAYIAGFNYAFTRGRTTSFIPAGPNVWNNFSNAVDAGSSATATLYIAGCTPSNHPQAKVLTYDTATYEWAETNYFWDTNESKTAFGVAANEITNGRYSNIISRTLPTGLASVQLTNANYPGGKNIYYLIETNLLNPSYIPYELDFGSGYARRWWGCDRAFFVVEVPFKKHF